MDRDDTEILEALKQLVGLKLSIARRACDMRVLHFGTIRRAAESVLPFRKGEPRGTVCDFALHIQCPWRIETDKEIVTGRADLLRPLHEPEGFSDDDRDYDRDGNVQDLRMERVMSNDTGLLVESVAIQSHGSFTIAFNGGYRLAVFPSGSIDEDWRLFRPEADAPHLVVSGGRIERDET